jgi:Type IX secretion system membrane protein PorP/SprF
LAHQLNIWSTENITIKINSGIESKLKSLRYNEADIRWPNPNFLGLSVQPQLYPDISAGTALQFSASKYNFLIGYTMLHINRPTLKVVNTPSPKKIRHQAFVIGDFNINSKIKLEPQCLITKYDLFNYYNAGMDISYAYNDKQRLLIGGGKSTHNVLCECRYRIPKI